MLFLILISPVIFVIVVIVVGILIHRKDVKKQQQLKALEHKERSAKDPIYEVEEKIKTFTDMGEYLIRDYIVSNNEEKADIPSFHIPLIYLSRRGMYVIDVNDAVGNIIGTVDSNYWIKEEKGFETTIKNPVVPNEKRTDFIARITKRMYPFHNIIVFTKGDLTKTVTNKNVVNINQLEEFLMNKELQYDDLELSETNRALMEYKEEYEMTLNQHERNLEKYLNMPK